MLAQDFARASHAGEARASSACMPNATRPVPHAHTAARAERLRLLIITLQKRQMMREDIGELLEVGPSGVRKYIKDLGAVIEVARYVDGTDTFIGYPVYQLALKPEEASAYLASLAAAPAPRGARSSSNALSIASKDPSRHFHILQDDAHYSIRLHRTPVVRDPLVAALFGPRAVEMRA